MYEVRKDGRVLREYKTLPAAKRLADAKGAEVVNDDKVIYHTRTEQYRLLHLMNVRKEPSVQSEKLAVWKAGTTVDVLGITDDFLHIRTEEQDAYILYGSGRYAERITQGE